MKLWCNWYQCAIVEERAAACVFEGGSSHPTMHCWRGLLYGCTVQKDRWRAILCEKQAIVLPQYRKQGSEWRNSLYIHYCTQHWNLPTVNIYSSYSVRGSYQRELNICRPRSPVSSRCSHQQFIQLTLIWSINSHSYFYMTCPIYISCFSQYN